MSYWYWRPLKSDWPLDEATTNKFDFPEKGHVSALALQLYNINELDMGLYPRPYPVQRITKQRVVGNGNFEIINAEARWLQAMNFWEWGQPIDGQYSSHDTIYQRNYWAIPFGRYLGDPEYGLKLENFPAGVEFEDTNDISTTYFTDGSTKYNIWALMRKNPEPGLFAKGFFKKRLIKTKDANTETQYAVKLPTRAKLKQIYIFSEPTISSYVQATAAQTLVKYLWLGVKGREEYILNNARVRDYVRHIHNAAGRLVQTSNFGIGMSTNSYTCYVDSMIYRRFFSTLAMHGASYLDNNAVWDANNDTAIFPVRTGVAGSAAEAYFTMHHKGIMLHGQIPVLFQTDINDPAQWLDAEALADVYIEVTEGSGSGNWYTVLDELEETYPT